MYEWEKNDQTEHIGLVKRTIGYRCQFKCHTMEGVVEHVQTFKKYGSPYETHFRCSYCERYFPYSLYGNHKNCPCCNRKVRRKGIHWKKLWRHDTAR